MSAAPAIGTALVETIDLKRHFRLPRHGLFQPREVLRAVDGVDLVVERGRSFGIVGESGCGKSTLARLVMALDRPTAGVVKLDGEDLFALPGEALKARRRHFQMVFQDPYGSLDPRMAVRRIVAEPLSVAEPSLTRAERRQRVEAALAAVGLKPADADKYPHEFSGGQRQRLAIARALITRPKLIVADEPVSALDVSVQAQVLNLMLDLAEDHGVTYLFISHNLMVVEHVCERLAVMYLGRVVETGDAAEIFARPAHPYTRALIDAAPSLTPTAKGERIRLDELGVAATGEGRGCAFADRCPRAEARCRVEEPALRQVAPDRQAACHFA